MKEFKIIFELSEDMYLRLLDAVNNQKDISLYLLQEGLPVAKMLAEIIEQSPYIINMIECRILSNDGEFLFQIDILKTILQPFLKYL